MKNLEFCEIFIREDGIAQIMLFPNIDVTPEHVKIMIHAILELTGGEPALAIMFIGAFSTFSKEAREYSAQEVNHKSAQALAYVIDNFGHKLVINFFIKINKPVIPIRVFMDEKPAVVWLFQQRK